MPIELRVAMRDWDFLTPILLGDVSDERLSLVLERVATLPGNPSQTRDFDIAEVSFSRFVQQRTAGHNDDTGIANFPMRSFRHRCIITLKSHRARTLSDLKGGCVGLTGWQDSGNTWTRHAFLDAGVRLEDVRWFVGRLTSSHPSMDRLGGFGQPGFIESVADDKPLLELLRAGELDAVLTPFMPEGFFAPASEFRPVLDDVVAAETDYFETHGFVPGIHVMAARSDVVARYPWVSIAFSDLLDRSWDVWAAKRKRYADTSPWLFEEHLRVGRVLPEDWHCGGIEKNRVMINTFVETTYKQNLIPARIAPEEIFASPSERANTENKEN